MESKHFRLALKHRIRVTRGMATPSRNRGCHQRSNVFVPPEFEGSRSWIRGVPRHDSLKYLNGGGPPKEEIANRNLP